MTETTDTAPKGDRIAKVIARSGRASRRDAEQLIAEGRVTVNGKTIDTPALTVTAKDTVAVDGTPLAAPEPPRLWLYHKPKGLVTTAKDEKGRPTVFAALPEDMPRVVSVGRLDLNSEGLLILTNDGAVKRRLELPATGWLRRYRVRVKGTPTEAQLAPLTEGMTVDGERFQPMTVAIDRQQGANAWLTVSLREGKNREIRRALEALGLTVNRLIRVSYGPFQLGDLAEGAVEEVKGRVVRDQLGLDGDFAPLGAPKKRPQRKRRDAASGGEAKAARRAARSTDEAKAARRAARPTDDAKAARRAARSTDEAKAARRAARPTDEAKAARRAARPTDDAKAARRAARPTDEAKAARRADRVKAEGGPRKGAKAGKLGKASKPAKPGKPGRERKAAPSA